MIRAAVLLAGLALAAPGADVPPMDEGPALIEGLDPSHPPPSPEAALALARSIGSELRCPVCQGLSVADSNSNAAVSMQRRIQALVDAGYTRREIEDYFISKYGEWVLLKPTNTGLNQLVWIGPMLALGLGVAASMSFLRRKDEDRGPDTIVDESPTRAPQAPTDPYTALLLQDVDDDT